MQYAELTRVYEMEFGRQYDNRSVQLMQRQRADVDKICVDADRFSCSGSHDVHYALTE